MSTTINIEQDNCRYGKRLLFANTYLKDNVLIVLGFYLLQELQEFVGHL